MNAPANPSTHLAVAIDALDHVQGVAHGGLSIVEYGDFECPSCAQAFPAVKMLIERFDNQLRFVFRHYPVPEVHPHAMLAAEAAEAAAAQGRFWPMHDLIFEHAPHVGAAELHRHARRLELDMARFEAELADHVYLQRVREHIASGVASHLRGTPSFFVGGELVDISFGLQRLSDAIERCLPQAP